MGEEKEIRAVKAGKRFAIELEAMPGAGYMWELASGAEQIELVSQKVVSIAKGIGGNATQRFVLVAWRAGNYVLSFQLKRKWEKEPVKVSVFTIQAK